MANATKLSRRESRKIRQARVRKKIKGSAERPRICVYRSLKATYAQAISDTTGKVIVAASTAKLAVKSKKSVEAATELGKTIAKMLLEQNVKTAVFDRNGYQYHGRVKAVAEGAREGGLEF
jgi:large subunit ribosomal protein L18